MKGFLSTTGESPYQIKKKGGGTITNREEEFCYYYHKLRDPKEAARCAGYAGLFSLRAQKLLGRADIRERLEELEQSFQKKELQQAVIAGLTRLAFGNTNDSVRLAFESEEACREQLEKLDLFPVSELKRPKENAMELKFFDRMKAMEKLLELVQQTDAEETISGFYEALEHTAKAEEEP